MKNNVLLLCAVGLVMLACKERKSQDRNAVYFTVPAVENPQGPSDPMASPDAVERGEIDVWGSEFPATLNVWKDATQSSAEAMGLMYESLVTMHSDSATPIGLVAQTWEISPDQTTFTFHLNPAAQWSDGKPIVAEDVQYYWDVIMDSTNLTPVPRVDMERFDRPEIIDAQTIRFHAKKAHWKNFWYAASVTPFPKHAWGALKFDQRNWDFDVVSGPYGIKKLEKQRYLLLQKRKDWWGRSLAWNTNKYNFQRIRYRYTEDRVKALEMLKKGDLDLYALYTASIWAKQTQFDAVNQGWVARQRIWNKEPIGFQGMVFNLRKPKFQDVRVRKALAFLLNRQELNKAFMFNQYFLLNSYFPDLYPSNTNPNAPQFTYSEDSARRLLAEAGWKSGAKGLLTKDGQPFEINFITAMGDTRHLEFYVQSLKKLGFKASISKMSYPAYSEKIDNRDFDLDWRANGAERLRDVESSWHSSQADIKASGNVAGLRDPQIDQWIAQMRLESNALIRDSLLKLIDNQLVKQMPTILMWQADNHRLLWWERFGQPQKPLAKYQREDAALVYWWVDEKKALALKDAKASNQKLDVRIGDLPWEKQ